MIQLKKLKINRKRKASLKSSLKNLTKQKIKLIIKSCKKNLFNSTNKLNKAIS
jgi:hypothetical protein